MSLNKEIEAHDYPINLCRDALNNSARHSEATDLAVTVCEQIMQFTGLSASDVFNHMTNAIGQEYSDHDAIENARTVLGLSSMHLVAA